MFQYDVSDFRDFSSKRDLEQSYYTFLDSIHQDRNTFPFKVENPALYKGKRRDFIIVGFGGYMAQDGWRVYLTYRASGINHVKQHTWLWDAESDCGTSYHLNEFVGL